MIFAQFVSISLLVLLMGSVSALITGKKFLNLVSVLIVIKRAVHPARHLI